MDLIKKNDPLYDIATFDYLKKQVSPAKTIHFHKEKL